MNHQVSDLNHKYSGILIKYVIYILNSLLFVKYS